MAEAPAFDQTNLVGQLPAERVKSCVAASRSHIPVWEGEACSHKPRSGTDTETQGLEGATTGQQRGIAAENCGDGILAGNVEGRGNIVDKRSMTHARKPTECVGQKTGRAGSIGHAVADDEDIGAVENHLSARIMVTGL